jgi:cytidine deaminase
MIETRKFSSLDEAERRLIVSARDSTMNAYAPYSGFAVGAAVLTRSGATFTGANLENASYGLGICAEVAALAKANSADGDHIEAIAVVGHKFTEPPDASQVVTPCGRCRQLIFEAAQIADTDIRVFSCSGDLEHIRAALISELLPEAFGPSNLGLGQTWPRMRDALTRRVAELRLAPAWARNIGAKPPKHD